MRSHCALYVDAGSVLASAATRVTGTSLRSGVQVDHAILITELIAQAEAARGLPLLRVHWYASGARRGGASDSVQEQIGMLQRVKLRLGLLSVSGEQKGVDVRLGLDLTTHARNGIADVMYLATGDDDLTEAVEEAQNHGIHVIVLAVPDATGEAHSVSRHLQRAADGVELIHPATIDLAVQATRPATESVPTAAPPRPVPVTATPALLARAKQPNAKPEPPATTEGPAPSGPAPRPADGTVVYTTQTSGPVTLDAHAELGTAVTEELVDEVWQRVLTTWLARAALADREELRRGKPFIPGDIDRALLLDLSDRTKIYYLDEAARYLLRRRAWDQAEQLLNLGAHDQ